MNCNSNHLIQTFLFQFDIRLLTLRGVQWLYKYQHKEWLKYYAQIFYKAIRINHLDIIQWIHEYCNTGNIYWNRAMDWAALNGQLHVIQWLHENRQEGCTHWAMDYAASRGHLHVIQWLSENRRVIQRMPLNGQRYMVICM